MAQNEAKQEKVNKNTPKRKKSENKANTKPQEQIVETVTEEITEEAKEQVQEYPEYHISQIGDTPYNLSKKYDVAISDITAMNPSIDWLNMKAGTKVRVK